ncbi:DUF5722 domain-containing protein [Phycisphaera mikurensis]|uniref:DUF5722 domain-containing protein n=1 Tax=Phycisphaera mikurensis (strain NBRC 102666 / KCTC 22515 / FYK2301M01) TaxID=1142394 RepID=I0IFB5_PHYMF|nr:DUF5722 domain-containing protein [Phycisphaera mikurensis]MBB6440654.1 hypothetical protein [Phycisphaera mikurensis]BAM03953.1 hypothetical protein PSMK_17940 [Phycisphaera mikurensis NBRC 102666]
MLHRLFLILLAASCLATLPPLSAAAEARETPLEKGVTVPVDLDDLPAIGVEHVTINLILHRLLDLRSAGSTDPRFSVDTPLGPRRFRPAAVRELDEEVRALNRRGVKVTAVVLNPVSAEAEANGSPLLHPDTDVQRAPNRLGAFNLASAEGRSWFDAFFAFMARRYGDPASPHGHIAGYVVGNEIPSHWIWHNMGEATEEEVARQHAEELRRAWIAASAEQPEVRIYTSLDHVWDTRLQPDPLRFTGGRFLLDRVVELTEAAGGVPFDVAYHPYPKNLRDARFWDDPWAMFGHDTPFITFKNLEVLMAYLQRPPLRVGGQPRRVILSEQGLDAGDTAQSEDLQAMAFALAWQRIERMPGIDAFIYHRHVDHRGEHGLKLGLWTEDPDADAPSVPQRARPLHRVFAAAGTDAWPAVYRTAQEHLPAEALALAEPRPGPFPEHAPQWAPGATVLPRSVGLGRGDARATVSDALAWSLDLAATTDGVLPALYHHPPGGGGVSTATFDIAAPGPSPRLTGAVDLKVASINGLRFAILSGDDLLWEATLRRPGSQPFSLPLAAVDGEPLRLGLRVDGLGNGGGDQGLWLNPTVVPADR